VVRLWFHRQGLTEPQDANRLTAETLRLHLERTGALQLDTINVVDRAHYLTLWSRFGLYDRTALDRWMYDDQVAYEYWGHEASLLPISHLPIGRRRMRRFPPKSWEAKSWWKHYKTSAASKRRVLERLEAEGPLESIDFEPSPDPVKSAGVMPLAREDKRSLKLLWHLLIVDPSPNEALTGSFARTVPLRRFGGRTRLRAQCFHDGSRIGRDRFEPRTSSQTGGVRTDF